MKKILKNSSMVIYLAPNGAIELRSDAEHDTVWATLDQISDVFDRDKSVISRHLKNIFFDKELVRNSVVAKNATTAADGKTYIVDFYNLDAILSVGYRVNSQTATQFRIWATKVLKEHITKGYTINRKRIAKNYASFIRTVSDIKALLPEERKLEPDQILDLVKEYATVWVSLDAYDRGTLKVQGVTKKSVEFTAADLIRALENLKTELMKKGEATDIFVTPIIKDAVENIIGNVMQTFSGRDVYPSVEEKAAHLLYFIVKNHPFIDGNKRSGAFAFIWFLRKTGVRGMHAINPSGLAALTLLIAESAPEKKVRIIALVTQLLR